MTLNHRQKLWIRSFQAATGMPYAAARRRQLNWPSLTEVMEEHELLGIFGLGVYDSPRQRREERRVQLAADRQHLRSEEDLVTDVALWLRDHVTPIKTVSSNSYGVKHLVQDATGLYTPNGVFIAAALMVGYPSRYDEPNVRFGMSRKDLKQLG